jgi:ABC-2 type transport system permease protein
VIRPVLLIAEREFRTYVATLSFWLSLAIAPLGAVGVLLFSAPSQPPALITIESGDSALAQSAKRALEEAGRLEGHSFVFGQGGASLVLSPAEPRVLDVTFGANFPLSATGRALVKHVVERDAARHASGNAVLTVREKRQPAAAGDAGLLSRLAAMGVLWLLLTGSLGMLLQAVARERANRALESLLACARPWQIVAGKMAGVGAVSMLVLAVWGGTAIVLGSLMARDSFLGVLLAGLLNPAMLVWHAAIYLCAYFFYGAATVMLGTLARDSASAQNAARPMFVLLLAAFFAALTSVGQNSAVSWLVYVPPFTPFLLLVRSFQDVAAVTQVFLLGLLLFSAVGMVFVAARSLNVAPQPAHIFRRNFWRVQPLV